MITFSNATKNKRGKKTLLQKVLFTLVIASLVSGKVGATSNRSNDGEKDRKNRIKTNSFDEQLRQRSKLQKEKYRNSKDRNNTFPNTSPNTSPNTTHSGFSQLSEEDSNILWLIAAGIVFSGSLVYYLYSVYSKQRKPEPEKDEKVDIKDIKNATEKELDELEAIEDKNYNEQVTKQYQLRNYTKAQTAEKVIEQRMNAIRKRRLALRQAHYEKEKEENEKRAQKREEQRLKEIFGEEEYESIIDEIKQKEEKGEPVVIRRKRKKKLSDLAIPPTLPIVVIALLLLILGLAIWRKKRKVA